jgi:hypothetical protein
LLAAAFPFCLAGADLALPTFAPAVFVPTDFVPTFWEDFVFVGILTITVYTEPMESALR